jgi:hypothetical protein
MQQWVGHGQHSGPTNSSSSNRQRRLQWQQWLAVMLPLRQH